MLQQNYFLLGSCAMCYAESDFTPSLALVQLSCCLFGLTVSGPMKVAPEPWHLSQMAPSACAVYHCSFCPLSPCPSVQNGAQWGTDGVLGLLSDSVTIQTLQDAKLELLSLWNQLSAIS